MVAAEVVVARPVRRSRSPARWHSQPELILLWHSQWFGACHPPETNCPAAQSCVAGQKVKSQTPGRDPARLSTDRLFGRGLQIRRAELRVTAHVMINIAKLILDHGQTFEIMAHGQFFRHAHTAVNLD